MGRSSWILENIEALWHLRLSDLIANKTINEVLACVGVVLNNSKKLEEKYGLYTKLDGDDDKKTQVQAVTHQNPRTAVTKPRDRICRRRKTRVIRECYAQSLPNYIYIPLDFVDLTVSSWPLSTSVNTSLPVDIAAEERAVLEILQTLSRSTSPVFLIDALTARHNATAEAQKLIKVFKIPIFATPVGKSIIAETHPRYCGTYSGQISLPGVQKAVESSDCVIEVGPTRTDCNIGGFPQDFSATQLISLYPDRCEVQGLTFPSVYLSSLLRKLVERAEHMNLPTPELPIFPPAPIPDDVGANTIVQSWFWSRIGRFAKPEDIIIAEAGTAQFGFMEALFSRNINFITQVYYGSIGYSVGSCLGASLAQREMQSEDRTGRTVLVVGDRSLQLTVQEIGTMVKANVKPIIIIINNKGYTIERAIHGAEQPYNDITVWKHKALFELFGVEKSQDHYHEVRTREELERVVCLPEYCFPESIEILEVHMQQMDVPRTLKSMMALLGKRNRS